MYKYMIIAIALMFITAGGYYVNNAGGGIMGNIITGNITSQESLIPVNIDEIPGLYTCFTASTCKNRYTLLLRSDKSAELIRVQKETIEKKDTKEINDEVITDTSDEERLINKDTATDESFASTTEKGNWDIGVQNMLVITLLTEDEINYAVPQKIVIKNVGIKTLSRISYTRKNYTDMNNPIFIKQD